MLADRVDLELGLESGGVLRCSVERAEAGEIARAFERGRDGLVSLAADRGRVVVDLRCVAYVRELAPRRLGFGA